MEYLDNANCSTLKDHIYVPIALSGLCLVSFIISIPGVVLGLHEYCIKNNISDLRTERLLLYLSCAASVFSMAGSFQWIVLFTEIQQLCSVLGYTWLVTGIFQTVITFCLGIHFFIQICQPKQLIVLRDEKIRQYKKLEILYFVTAVVLSLLLSPWPFIDGSFGNNDWICFINTKEKCSKQHSAIGFIQVTAFYLFLTITFLFTFCIATAIQVMICLKKRSTKNLYLPVFKTYLIVSMVIITVTMIVNFPLNQQRISIHTIQAISSIAIAIAPLSASLVTSVAVIYKKLNCINWHSHSSTRRFQYQSINDSQAISSETTIHSSNTRSTFWDSPGTDDVDHSTSDFYYSPSSTNRVYNYKTV